MSKRKLKAKPKDKTTHEQLMDEIKSGSILKRVPSGSILKRVPLSLKEMRPCPKIKCFETAKGKYFKRTVIHIAGFLSDVICRDFKAYQTVFSFIETIRGITGRQSTESLKSAGVLPAATSNGSSLAGTSSLRISRKKGTLASGQRDIITQFQQR